MARRVRRRTQLFGLGAVPKSGAAGKALLDLLPTSGTYYIPSPRHDADTLSGLFEAGPIAFIHFHRQGRPQHDPTIMIKGFFLDLGVVILLAALLRTAAPALPTFTAHLKFLTLVALTATVLIDLGDIVWWTLPWPWKLHQAAYNLTAILIPGLVLARFIRPDQRTAAPNTP